MLHSLCQASSLRVLLGTPHLTAKGSPSLTASTPDLPTDALSCMRVGSAEALQPKERVYQSHDWFCPGNGPVVDPGTRLTSWSIRHTRKHALVYTVVSGEGFGAFYSLTNTYGPLFFEQAPF